MSEIAKVVADRTGIDLETAEKASAIMLRLLETDGDEDVVSELMDKVPGSRELAAQAPSGGGLGFLAKFGGGAVAAYGKLTSAGLDSTQIKAIGEALFRHAGAQAGPDLVLRAAKSVPGLARFM